MRVACPECAAEYDVPDAALVAGRRLRCSACGSNWDWSPPPVVPEPAPPQPAKPPAEAPRPAPAQPAAAPSPEPPGQAAPESASAPPPPGEPPRIEVIPEGRIAAATPPPRQGGGATVLAWVASLVILIAALAALYVWRAPIMLAWPPAIRLYAALGLA